MTLNRTPIARTGTLKPALTRECAVKGCVNRFQPRSITHKVCGPACAEAHAAAEGQADPRAQGQAKTCSDYLK